jgi:small GTP-binding protein
MTDDFERREHKVVFIGDSNTGKTTIIYKYLNLTQNLFPTVAAASFPIVMSVQGSNLRINCWDTAGQEHYRCLVPIYARNAEVACLVFDQTNMASFESLKHWLDFLESDVGAIRVIVVSNKCDLDPVVPLDLAIEFCTQRKLPIVITSAFTGLNVHLLFEKIGEMILEDGRKGPASSEMEEFRDRGPVNCCGGS